MVKKIKSHDHNAHVYFDSEYNPIVLPTLFSCFLNTTGKSYSKENLRNTLTEKSFEEKLVLRDLSELTIQTYENELRSYLEWIELYFEADASLSVHHHHNANADTLNIYLNNELIENRQRSLPQLVKAKGALDAYYNYLMASGLIDAVEHIQISPQLKALAADNTNQRTAVKYLSQKLRNELIRNAKCKRDEMILRMAYECGLRAKEIKGLRLNDAKIGTKSHKGFLSLFDDLKTNPDQAEFTYYLQGKYSKAKRQKGGESREVYLHRTVLEGLKEYYETERPEFKNQALFITKDGGDVKTHLVDKLFRENRDSLLKKYEKSPPDPEMQKLEKDHTYHCLRHTFGTDKFDEACKQHNIAIDNVTATSAPYLLVARLLGHKINDKRGTAVTTSRYIHSCKMKRNFEKRGG